ncbi:MAG: SpoIIE family protein phosphatase [Bacteroidetes bacterium]|nr:SpoIIE family protein phosphatase [Bacteroidota bacterium]
MEETSVPEINVKQEFYRSTEKFHVITCWVGIALNLVWFISDIFVLPEYWLAFFIFRASVSLIATLILISRKITGINIYTTMFILVLGISIQNAFMWSVMDIAHFQQHAFAYMVLFIGVGMLVLWEVIFSVIILAATIVSNVIFYAVNSQLSIQEFVINGGLLILTVAIFCVFLIRTRYRLTYNEIRSRLELARSKEIIEEAHTEVVNQKKEITDSINYARSIQQSLIPLEDHFNRHFTDSFVLFKPKDIVSGDFYWIYEKNNIVFYATGDCTGHGVPGGFMTMLGISFLNEIVEVKGITTPSEILNNIRDKIITTLKQHGNFGESKDGMDITVCSLDKTKKELQYASANNALYIVRAEKPGHGQEMEIHKADKQPCGFYHVYKPFTNNIIKLEAGDSVYTFSDGFPDQFGGPAERKYMHKQFKEVLLQNAHINFTDQKNLLNASFENWRGKQDQIDDVLVIGVKV